MRSSLSLLLLISICFQPASAAEVVGTLPGEVVVDSSGSANYSIPIDVPPGRAGMQPELALVYSSSGGSGLMGSGWSLSGMSSITRGGTMYARDAFVDPPDGDASDKFYLDGQRLIHVAEGQDTNGPFDEFRTESESFSVVRAYGGDVVKDDGKQGVSPAYFLMETKSGLLMRYGQTSISPYSVQILGGLTMTWSLARTEDTSGNNITYHYTSVDGLSNSVAKNFALDRIDYTGHSTLQPFASIKIIYEDNLDAERRICRFRSETIRVLKRVKSIYIIDYSVAPGFNPASDPYHAKYVLSYSASPEGMSVLDSVQYFRRALVQGSWSEEELKPTEFRYVDQRASLLIESYVHNSRVLDTGGSTVPSDDDEKMRIGKVQILEIDLNGDGYSELVRFETNQSAQVIMSAWQIDPDGIIDNSPFNFAFTGENGQPTAQGPYILSDPVQSVLNGNATSMPSVDTHSFFIPLLGDFNGDGRVDILLSHLWKVWDGSNNVGSEIFRLYINTGDGLRYAGSTIPDPVLESWSVEDDLSGWQRRNHVFDFNGDGLSDLVQASCDEDNNSVYVNKLWYTSENQLDQDNYLRDHYTPGAPATNGIHVDLNNSNRVNLAFVDFTQDGAPDLIVDYEDEELSATGNYRRVKVFASIKSPSAVFDYATSATRTFDVANVWSDEHSVQYVDIDSDGLSDVVVSMKTSFRIIPNVGNAYFVNAPVGTAVTPSGQGACEYLSSSPMSVGAMNTLTDVNGDGLVDLIFYFRQRDTFRCEDNDQWSFYYPESHRLGIKLNVGGAFDTLGTHQILDFLLYDDSDEEDDFPRNIFATDIKQDGAIDIVEVDTSEYGGVKVRIRHLFNPETVSDQPRGALVEVKNGLGATTEIKYSRLTEPRTENGTFVQDADGRFESRVYVKGGSAEYPLVDVIGPMPIVTSLGVDNGGAIGDESTRVWTSYSYRDAIADVTGRGFLGFKEFISFMWQLGETSAEFDSGIQNIEHLAIDFPRTGMTTKKESKFAWKTGPDEDDWATHPLTEEVNTLIVDAVSVPVDPGSPSHELWSLFPMVVQSTEKKWELPENPPTENYGDPYLSTTTTTTFDDMSAVPTADFSEEVTWGNIKEVKVVYASGVYTRTQNSYVAGSSAVVFGKLLDDSPTKAEAYERFGRLTESTVTHYDASADPAQEQRKSKFTYDDDGLLETETVQPDSDLALTTTYKRDSYGNVTEKIISGEFGDADMGYASYASVLALTVEKITDWDDDYRWAEEKVNGVGDAENFQYRAPYGELLVQTGPNGVSTTWQYDAFGRVKKEIRADGTIIETARIPDTSVTIQDPGGVWQFPITVKSIYRVETTGTQMPKSIAYYDRLNREIRATTQSLNANGSEWIYKDTLYGQHGEVLAASDNYFGSGNPNTNWTKTRYDKLMRPKLVEMPNGTTVAYKYDGLTAWVIKKNGSEERKSGTIKDVKGQVVETRNPSPATSGAAVVGVVHEYSASGNLVSTTPNGDPGQMITFGYDEVGNKISMDDPDMGSWTYNYDALGRLRRQEDAAGIVTEMDYDDLGRLIVRRIERNESIEELTHFYYYEAEASGGSRPQNGWIGALQREVVFGNGSPAYGSSYSPSQVAYQRGFYYDDLGRKYLDLYFIDDKWYYTHTAYDNHSRPSQVSHFWRPKGMEYDFQTGSPVWHSYGVNYTYSNKSTITSVRDTTGRLWWDQPTYDAFGRLVSYRNGQTGTYTTKEYDPLDHTLDAILTGNGVGQSQFQNLDFEFDPFGNLEWRKTTYESQTNWEQFTYDRSDRLLTVTRSGGETAQPLVDTTLQYFANGNIEKKDGFTFAYGANGDGIHAVTSASHGDGRAITMGYDANGRMNSRKHYQNGSLDTTWSIQWMGFGKPYSMFKGSDGHKFEYDAAHNRIVHVRVDNNAEVEKRIYVGGSMEQFFETDGQGAWSAARTRIYVGGPSGIVGVFNHDANLTDPTANTAQWLLTDHLGSTETVLAMVDGAPEVAQRLSFDPWGNRRDAQTWADYSDPSVVSTEYTDRGFTGHEMLDDTGLVHMNGRIYDPLLGRFLSADPHVQSPGDSQSYNRYSYVHNNPLRYSDPTGYFLDDLWDSISGFVKKYWRVIVAIAVSVVTAGLMSWALLGSFGSIFTGGLGALAGTWTGVGIGAAIGAAAGFAGGFVGTLLAGGDLGAAFSAGLSAGLLGAAAGAIGGLDISRYSKVLAHGITGGAYAEASGSSFGSGFLASGFAAGVSHFGPDFAPSTWADDVIAAAVVGGTAAEIGGGKFENGAVSGAFQYLFNQIAHKSIKVAVKVVYDKSIKNPSNVDVGSTIAEANTILESNGFTNTEFVVLEERHQVDLAPEDGKTYSRADLDLAAAGYSESDKITIIVTKYEIVDATKGGMWVEGSNIIISTASNLSGTKFLHEVGHVIDYIGSGRNPGLPGNVRDGHEHHDQSNIMYWKNLGGTHMDAEYKTKLQQFIRSGSSW